MAVTFKTNDDYGYQLLSLFGVPAEAIHMAKEAGVHMAMVSPGNFKVSDKDGNNTTVVPIKAQAISLAKSGSLGPASADSIKFSLIQALKTAMQNDNVPSQGAKSQIATPAKPTPDILGMMSKKAQSESSVAKTPEVTPDTIAKKPSEGSIAPPPAGMKPGQSPVPLMDANEVYQPVKGTSKTSIYIVALRLKGLNVAVRNQAGTLSIRAEGSKLNAYAEDLGSLGFDIHASYASVHLKTSDSDLKIKAIGAVSGRLGMHNLLQAADLTKLVPA